MVTPCSRLWTDINLNTNKKEVLNCCKRRQLQTPSIEEISTSNFWYERKELVDAKKYWISNSSFPTGCEACSEYHPNSHYTARNEWSEIIPDLSKDHTQQIEIGLGNKCNQTCMYCSAQYSSLWAKKLGLPAEDEDLNWKNTALDSLYEYIGKNLHDKPHITYNFIGGETFLIDDFLIIVERLSSIRQECTMNFISNLNLGPSVIQNFIDLCKKFPKISFSVQASIENKGERAEAVREGLDFSRLEYNLNWLMSEPSVQKVGFQPTMNALSVTDHEQFLTWATHIVTKHRKLEDFGKTWTMTINSVTEPKAMHPGILPKNYTSYLDKVIDFISIVPVKEKHIYITHLTNIKNQLGTRRSKEYLDNAYQWYKKQEKLHNRDYWKIFPELNDIFFK